MSIFKRMWRLRDAYRETFGKGRWRREGRLTDDAILTLTSLKKFCRAEASAFDADPRVHALLEGRRECWLEIQRVLKLDDTDLMRLREPDEERKDE